MTTLPTQALHLTNWPMPPWLEAALAELGQREVAGRKSNPRILEYRAMAGIKLGGDDGEIPWCAIFVNAMLAKSGVKTSGNAMARGFARSSDFERLDKPIVGCITVIASPSRGPAAGHVFFYTGENGLFFQALGGNQGDAVDIAMFHKSRLVGHFWPKGFRRPNAPFDQPVRLARPLLPHEKKAVSDV